MVSTIADSNSSIWTQLNGYTHYNVILIIQFNINHLFALN